MWIFPLVESASAPAGFPARAFCGGDGLEEPLPGDRDDPEELQVERRVGQEELDFRPSARRP